jgi:outer membrane receptor protein involved in Fe transport
MQSEFRHRNLKHGDLSYTFDLTSFDKNLRRNIDSYSIRIGAHYEPATHSDIIASVIYQKEEEKQEFENFENRLDSDGYIAEAQYMFHLPRFKIIAGGSYFKIDNNDTFLRKFDTSHSSGYMYSYIQYPQQITWTFGVSYDSVDEGLIGKFDKLNWKFGSIWNVTSDTTLRFAVFKTLKRSLLTDQTIEPTQIAGFNQHFDNHAGTEIKRFAAAIDQKLFSNLYGGFEVSRMNLNAPIIFGSGAVISNQQEDLYRAYINWTPHKQFSINIGYQQEQFEADDINNTRTQLLPVALKYIHPTGLFARIKATYVDQEVQELGENDFTIVDAGIGYRLPNRYGIIQLEAKNLLDKKFMYFGSAGRSPRQEESPLFIPERLISFKVTLSY